ncbi:MAG: hypothetical protein ACJ788_00205 [Ktedonobacteraceae bacterium]
MHHERYLEDGKVTDELLGSCLNLAIIDGLVRAGEIRGELGVADPKDLRDLRNLLAIVPSTPFQDGGSCKCKLNPAFPFPSGADCDLLIDNTLIEIKTTKLSEMKQEYYQQLLGYYLLNLRDSRFPDTINPPSYARASYAIQRIGVYFSRHGYLWTVNIEDIANDDTFHQFLPFWDEQVKQYHGERTARRERPPRSLEELTAEVDRLRGTTGYMHWLSQLNDADFSTWKEWATASYYVYGALEAEQERRTRLQR